jgi:predicted amidohydrolase YtcJ
MASDADLLIVGGDVFTVDPSASVAEAVAVRDGLILAVGRQDELRELAGPHTRVVDVAGRTVLPGINDSHLHGCAFGLSLPPLRLDLAHPTVTSIAEITAAVRLAAARTPAGEWILGGGWDTGYLAECQADPNRQPDRADLDRVAPEHPVCLQDFSGHVVWVNTAALRAAGVRGDTPAPPGGVIVADAQGEPTGLLREAAQELVQLAVPAPTAAQREAGITAALRILHEQGITSFTEPGLGPGGHGIFGGALAEQTLDVYADMARAGRLAARLTVLALPTGMTGSAKDLAAGLETIRRPADVDPRRLNLTGIKIFADGIPPSETAWMYQPYRGGDACGSLCVAGDSDAERVAQVREMIRLSHEAGYQVGVHVTGDRAIDTVVDAMLAALHGAPRDARHYVIHGDFTGPATLARMAAGGIGANMNPAIKWMIADNMDSLLAPELIEDQYPVRSAIEAGVRVMSSSDAPVTYPNWRQAVSTMMLRESRGSGRAIGAAQCVGLTEALRAYTVNAAWQDFAEDWKGSIEPGKVADLCVTDGDLLHADPHDIPDMPIAMTVLGGDVVYDTLS